jgi:ribosomal protein L34E
MEWRDSEGMQGRVEVNEEEKRKRRERCPACDIYVHGVGEGRGEIGENSIRLDNL